jgi:hypothetical protein
MTLLTPCCHFQNYLGSCPILVMSGEAWDTLYISTGEARTANRERPHACTHLPLPPTIDG